MRGLGFVAAAALITAASVMMDAKGARLSQSPVGYAATIAVLNAVAMAALQASRGHNVTRMLVREWPVTVYAAAISSVSYQLFIWLLQQAPVALVGAMRETSMLFALFIAFFVLRERFGLWRWVAVARSASTPRIRLALESKRSSRVLSDAVWRASTRSSEACRRASVPSTPTADGFAAAAIRRAGVGSSRELQPRFAVGRRGKDDCVADRRGLRGLARRRIGHRGRAAFDGARWGPDRVRRRASQRATPAWLAAA